MKAVRRFRYNQPFWTVVREYIRNAEGKLDEIKLIKRIPLYATATAVLVRFIDSRRRTEALFKLVRLPNGSRCELLPKPEHYRVH